MIKAGELRMIKKILQHKLKIILFAMILILSSWFYFNTRAPKEPPEKADLVYHTSYYGGDCCGTTRNLYSI